MTANTVEQWLADAIGLDASTLGPQAVANAVKKRMAACNLTKESDYLERLHTALAEWAAPVEWSAPTKSPASDELLALIEMIVVPETWFFRDREPFIFLAQYVHTTWLTAHHHDRLRVLSIPCSTGEEPYSIAMALQSAGLRPARYRIDAVDINPALLHKAEKGAYGPNSFRSGFLENCECFFKLEGATRIVGPEARVGIRFIHGNIMNPSQFAAEQTYDIIFCRNLLIYQHMEARGHIIAALDRLLKPEGLLFVGHAEMMAQLTERYTPVRHNGAFAYCKISAHNKTAEPQSNQLAAEFADKRGSKKPVSAQSCADLKMAGPDGQSDRKKETARQAGAPHQSNSQNKITAKSSNLRLQPDQATSPLHEPDPTPASRLDSIRVLADKGRLDEAAAMCHDLLKECPQLAEAHLLLGVIRTAEGQVQAAEECLNHALYLDADCYEALMHLSLLKARRGDEAGAERLRRHAERVRDHAKATP